MDEFLAGCRPIWRPLEQAQDDGRASLRGAALSFEFSSRTLVPKDNRARIALIFHDAHGEWLRLIGLPTLHGLYNECVLDPDPFEG